MNLFIKVIKRFLTDFLLYVFLPMIFPRMLIILYHTYVLDEKPQTIIDSFPTFWMWVFMLIFFFIVSFVRAYTDNKNWPRKKSSIYNDDIAEAENAKKIKEIEKQQTLVEKLSQIPKIPEGEVQEYTTAENQARVALAVEQLKKFKINTPLQTPKETFFPDEKDEPEMVVLGSYILSVEDTATLAEEMRKATSPAISVGTGLGSLLPSIFKAIPAVVSDWLSMGSLATVYAQVRLYDEEVIEAARHGRRVKITIIDFKNFHSSTSIRMKYEMIE